MSTIKQRSVKYRLHLYSPKCRDGDSLMKRAMMLVQGVLFFSAVVPGVAVAALNAASVDFGDVQQGVSVTKPVTVTNEAAGFHYLLDSSGSGSTVTVLPGTCPSGAASDTVTTCQVQVTLPAGSVGSGTDSVDIDYKSDDMPFRSDDTGLTASTLTISVTYSVVALAPATPVSTLPLFGLGILVSLLGLFGLRKLRQ